MSIQFTTSTDPADLKKILALQKANLKRSLTPEEIADQGFVTVRHNFRILEKMNRPFPHIIAKDGDTLAGYALVMRREFEKDIPVLQPMFGQFNNLIFNGRKLGDESYFVMGQICVAKPYRGAGIFAGLYAKMREEMAPHFQYVITEIDKKNTRSQRAHEKVGFKTIAEYHSDFDGEDWLIVLWDLRAK